MDRVTGDRCYDHNFLRFFPIFGEKIGVFLKKTMSWSQFSAIFPNFRRKNWRFSQKPMLWSQFLQKTSSSLSKKRQFFRWIFRRKCLKNHNIGPWLDEFSPVGAIVFLWTAFWKFLKDYNMMLYIFARKKPFINFYKKNFLGYTLGDFSKSIRSPWSWMSFKNCRMNY
jgi:hypothetical protein